MVRRRSPLAVALILAGAALIGCSSTVSGSGSGSSAASTLASSPAPTTSHAPPPFTASAPPTPVPTSSTATHASTPQCLSDIRVIPQDSQGAAGHISLVLVFNNVSTTKTCEIIGYPGVDLVTPGGATVVHLRRTLRGFSGGEAPGVTAPRPVILAPGQSASAVAEASDVPQGGITDCGSFALLITVPNQFTSVGGGTAMLPRCDAQIHPVVPGTTGQGH